MRNISFQLFSILGVLAAFALLSIDMHLLSFPAPEKDPKASLSIAWPDAAIRAQEKHDWSRAEYDDWVRAYTSSPLTTRFESNEVRIKLIITAIEGDEQKALDRESSILSTLNDRTVAYGCQIFNDGRIHFFHRSSRGIKGGGYPIIPERDLERLDQLLAKLPDDGSRLPPAGRRVVVQVADADRWQVRVYDRANAAAEILEILRLSRSGIRSWLLNFQPAGEWDAHEHSSSGGTLSLSPDNRQIITASTNGPFKFWDPDTQKAIEEIATPRYFPVDALSFSPDGSIAVVQGWGEVRLLNTQTWRIFRELAEPIIGGKKHTLSCPQFTPDGRYLLLQSNESALRIFDTKTWKRRETLPGLPRDAISYIPAPRAERAIYLSKSGILALWDTGQRREIAKLDETVRLHRVAFSPDELLVAVATAHKVSGDYWGAYRIRIWRTDNGELEGELRPFEQRTCEAVEGLLWWHDGKYLLAATKADNFFTSRGIGVWSAHSGRHRGELTGCPTNVTGLALLADGRRIVAGCADGRIRVWDAASALKQIGEFESSLTEVK